MNQKTLTTTNILNTLWLKATVIGSLWGGVEIILGSFLHNLRIPFSGTFLSAFGVIIMVAGFRLWQEKGLLWRAALICALMKSISPSAMIFGPMICIFGQGLMMELAIRLIGSNLIAYMTGGGLAVLVSLIYKISFLLITYGFDLLILYNRLYSFASKQIQSDEGQSWKLIVILASIYFSIGIIAALIGYFTYNKSRQNNSLPKIISDSKTGLFAVNPNQHFSVYLLFFHIIMIVMAIVLVNILNVIWSTALLLTSIIISFLLYRNSLKRLTKPMLWIQFFVITLLAGLFLNNLDKGHAFISNEGIIAGLKMNIRAIIIVLGFASLSVEMRNPKIKLFFSNKRMQKVYLSLELAFGALPTIISEMASPKQFIRNPMQSLSALINQAEAWLIHFSDKTQQKNKITIITGSKSQGKTTFILELVNICKLNNLKVAGIVSKGFWENNKRHHYDIIDIDNNRQMQLCSVENKTEIKFGPFYFNPDAIEFSKEVLSASEIATADIIFIDEAGLWEIQDGGWALSISNILKTNYKHLVLCVREDFADAIIDKWVLNNANIYNIETQTASYVFELEIMKFE